MIDVQQFSPDEIVVKTVDKSIVVEGKHQEQKRDEQGYIARQFVRRYILPESHDMSQVTSSLSSDGILTVQAPKLVGSISESEKVPVIPVQEG